MFELLRYINNDRLYYDGFIDYSMLPDKLVSVLPDTFKLHGIDEESSIGLYCERTSLFMPLVIVLDKIGCSVFVYNKNTYEEKKRMSFSEVDFVIMDQIDKDISCEEVTFFEDSIFLIRGGKEGITFGRALLSFYTSGVTGKSSEVVKDNAILVAEAMRIIRLLHLTDKDKILCNAPAFHSFGQAFGCYAAAIAGAKVRYMQPFVLPSHILSELGKDEYTILISTPAYYKSIYKHLEVYPSLKYKLSAGGKLSNEVLEYGVRINNVYGTTETGAMAIQLFLDSEDSASVGHEMPGVMIEFDTDYADSQIKEMNGRVKVKTPFHALWVKDGETRKELGDDFFMLNDIAYRDTKGNIYIYARCDGTININGEKVMLSEIEKALSNLDYVNEYKVQKCYIGDGRESTKAFVVVKNNENVNDIRKSLTSYIENYKIPREIRIVKELKRSEMGKILANQE